MKAKSWINCKWINKWGSISCKEFTLANKLWASCLSSVSGNSLMFKLRWNILRIFWRYAANYLDYNDLDPGLIQVQLKYLQIYFWWFLQWEDKVSLCCWVVIENGNLTKQNSEIFKFYKRENAKYNPSSLSLSALKSNKHPSSNRDIQHLYFF